MLNFETPSARPYTVNLTTCDREPIHHINAVQPIGFLLALSKNWVVDRVSRNTPDFLGLPMEALLGAELHDILRSDAVHIIRNRLAALSGPDAIERSFAVQLRDDGPRYDLAIHRLADMIVVEAEPSHPAGDLNAGAMVRSMLMRMKGEASLLHEAARLMQALTGFDRVMIYRFHPDGSGEVVAERVRTGIESFLGLRYPVADIPQQARALLVRNPVRILVDVNAEPSPLVPLDDAEAAPLDLSMSTLRAHSVMHIQYLQNMGVGGTMTVSLVRDGALWGLISCHHMTPRHVGFEQRTTAELFSEVLSLLIEKQERADLKAYEAHAEALRQQLIATIIERGAAAQTIGEIAKNIAKLVPSDGYAIYLDGNLSLNGGTPTASECTALRSFLDEHAAEMIYATAELGQVYKPARDFVDRAAGVLVLPLSRSPRDYLVFFRREMAHAITWAGRPDKVPDASGLALSPRQSFAAWQEIVRGQSAAWTPAELAAVQMMRVTLLEIVLQQSGSSETAGRAAIQKQELLIAELNHRVRNILGLIRGLVTQSRMSALDVDTFASVLGDRIHALARAHDQITALNWGPGALSTLIATEAAAFLGAGEARVSFGGPAILLVPQAFSALVLVIHELMTNAAKHGALAGEAGTVDITWDLDADDNLLLHWQEIGGAPVKPPVRRGFGSVIIHRSIPHELGGQASVEYAPAGLQAHFVVPAVHIERGGDIAAVPTRANKAIPETRFEGTVLLVEDNIIIALAAEDLLTSLGAERVLVANTVAEALHLLTIATPTFALLDINLGTDMSWPVAMRLRELGIRHVFATGYGKAIVPIALRQVPVLIKPYTRDSLSLIVSDNW